jgi:glycerophosphoryl diester phosphodiesterase
MARAEIAEAIGVEPLLVADALVLTAGRPKLLEVEEPKSLLAISRELAGVRAREVVIDSFNDSVLRYAKRLGARTALAVAPRRFNPTLGVSPLSELFPAGGLWRCRADFVAPHARLVRPLPNVLRWSEHPAVVWGVDTDDEIERCLELGVMGIVTPRPDAAVALRDR